MVRKIHRHVRERTSRRRVRAVRAEQRRPGAIVRTGPVFARILEAKLVRRLRGEIGHETAVDGVGVIAFQPVGAAGPRVDVERAVFLLGPGVVVLERQHVAVRQTEIQFGQQRTGTVGAGNRPEIAPQGASIRGVHPSTQRVERGARRPRALLHLIVNLLVVGDEEECAIALQGSAEGEAELVLTEVGLERHSGMDWGARQSGRLPEIVHRAAQLVRSRLRNHVHETAR